MRTNCVSQAVFSGVIPVRVYYDNLRVYDENLIRKACQKATKVLAGPIEAKNYDLAKQLEMVDDTYSFRQAVAGYCKSWRDMSTGEIMSDVPSDYFKIIFDFHGNPFITTGKESFHLATIGKALGHEKKKCKMAGVKISKDLIDLKKYYSDYISSIVYDKTKRLKDNLNLGIAVKTEGKGKQELEELFLIRG